MDLERRLQDHGFSVVSQPLIEIKPHSEIASSQRRLIYDLDSYTHVIFVSTNAVRFGMEQIDNLWPQLPAGLNWYGVGAATEEALACHGVPLQSPIDASDAKAAMNSEELLAREALAAVDGDKVLIVRGVGGRPLLGEVLASRGATVDYLEVYERQLPRLSAGQMAATIKRAGIGLILLGSGQALANLQVLVDRSELTAIFETPVLVAGERIAIQARADGFRRVLVANNPGDSAMIEAVLRWREHTQ
jgi:uroporphyrinogen-III synthase